VGAGVGNKKSLVLRTVGTYLCIRQTRGAKVPNEKKKKRKSFGVVSSPDILGGTPVIRGTRVPVHYVAAAVAAELPIRELLAIWPHLDEDTFRNAAEYAEAHPLTARTSTTIELPHGATVLVDRRVPLRRGTTDRK
jgi:uncharacterized protein (DUF433 family)